MKLQSLPTGTELVADFRVERVLGAGGFGITYLAEEPALARKVTIKEYFPNDFAHRGENNEAVPRSRNCAEDYKWGLDRFIEEAQTLAKFDHRNIVRVYRYFRANNTGYMVLHFEEGKSLKGWLQSLGRAPRQNELDRILAPLLEALSVIHAADFLHRDIAPDNIIIRKDGSPVLIDFGSARGEIAQHTRTVSALVKPGYSPYEQYSEIGKQQGPWTDIYALAATLYHAITGKRPPDAPSRIVKDERKSAREAAIGAYRPGFLDAIDRGLALEIEKRPQSIAAWRGALLAPEPEPKRWFGRPAGPETNAIADDADVAKTRPLTNNPPLDAAPPPPDAPGRKGRLVDYIEGLKGSQPSKASPAAPASAKTDETATRRAGPSPTRRVIPPAAVAADGNRPPKRGLGGLFSRSDRITACGTNGASRVEPTRTPADAAMAAAAAPHAEPVQFPPAGALMPLPPTPLRPAGRRRPPKPRAIRSGKKPWWRPLALKLLIGLGIASLAVAYQQRMPQWELRSLGMVSSSARTFEHPADATGKQSRRQVAERSLPKPAPSLLIRRFEAHMPGATHARFARSGQWIATTGADGTLLLWDTVSAARIRTIEMDEGPATALSISGDRALTGHSEGTTALWDGHQARCVQAQRCPDLVGRLRPRQRTHFRGQPRLVRRRVGSRDTIVPTARIQGP
jgi:serine/threonine protein kinase